MKNVVVCCDGTANEFAADKTNVVRLFSTLVQSDEQVAAYLPGIGTMEPPGSLTNVGRRWTRLLARAIGYGFAAEIQKAYEFVVRYYEPGDRLYMFGFSRGAYTARAVAALIRMYGLLPPQAEALTPYAIRLIMSGDNDTNVDKWFGLAQEFKATFPLSDCSPHFVGVWNTVSSVGWLQNPLRIPHTRNNPEIRHGRHAVAIDERRAFFRTNLWQLEEGSQQDLKQVWFAGVHSDVGGGYPEAESGLSKISLEWMIIEAVACGLRVDHRKVDSALGRGNLGARPDPNALLHHSLTPCWWPAEVVPKRRWNSNLMRSEFRMNLGRARRIPGGALVHQSVLERHHYSPLLPEDVNFV